jgi:hypothetical protein
LLVLLGGAQAHATCGDWLAHPDDGPPAGSAPANHPDSATSPGPLESNSQPGPCRGAFCGQSPSTPIAPPRIQRPTTRDRVVAMLVADEASEAASCDSSLYWQCDAAPLAGFSSRIDHPPRA